MNQQCVVHYFKCDLCDADYVGYTARHLYQRIAQHKNSAIGRHFLQAHGSKDLLKECQIKVLRKCQGKFDCLSPGQTIEQSWIQRSNFARSNIVRSFGHPCWKTFVQLFCSIKCWMEFAFDQTLQPTILRDVTMLQCLAAISTK